MGFGVKQNIQKRQQMGTQRIIFSCPDCGKQYYRKAFFQKHQKIHMQNSPFSCSVCGEGFNKEQLLQRHQTVHTDERLSCTECEKVFIRSTHLKRHEKIHTKKRPHYCTKCKKVFSRKDHLNRHLIIHSRKIPFPCPQCKLGFRRLEHLRRHQRIHTDEKPYSCDECGGQFSRKDHLQRHQRHAVKQSFSSMESGIGFKQVQHLEKRKRISGNVSVKTSLVRRQRICGERPVKKVTPRCFSCTQCDKSFGLKISLLRHQAFHTQSSTETIAQSAHTRETNSARGRQLKTLTETLFACTQCDKSFNLKKGLLLHQKVHGLTYSCADCEETFNLKKHLLVHQKVHIVPYSCADCSKSFSKKSRLRKHQRIHADHCKIEGSPEREISCAISFDREHALAAKEEFDKENEGDHEHSEKNCSDLGVQAKGYPVLCCIKNEMDAVQSENYSNKHTAEETLEVPSVSSRRVVLKAATFVFKSPATVIPPVAPLPTELVEETSETPFPAPTYFSGTPSSMSLFQPQLQSDPELLLVGSEK